MDKIGIGEEISISIKLEPPKKKLELVVNQSKSNFRGWNKKSPRGDRS